MSNSGNVSIKMVSAYLGHSDMSITNRYLHPDMSAKIHAANIISQMINADGNADGNRI